MKCTVIGIAGGTGSGKSTFTARIKAAFPDKVAVLYHDNYYKAHDNIPFEERKTINYDHPNSLETDLLIEHVKSLKNDKSVDAPTYDFTRHTRAEATLHIEPKPIIIIEGILTLQNVELVNLMDIKIFVEADADERILRRAIRDVKERGRDLEGVAEQYLQTVKPMHYLYVEPTKNVADIVINSGMNDVAFDIVSTNENATETAKNEGQVRTDAGLHSGNGQGHGVCLLSAVRNCHRSEPPGQTTEVLLLGMPLQVEQHSSATAELEDRAVKGLPGVRQGVFLPSPVRASEKILQPCLCQQGQGERRT